MPESTEARLHERFSVLGPVQLLWADKQGTEKRVQGTLRDVSERGLQIETAEPVEVGLRLRVESPKFEPVEGAQVRHCRQKAGKWRIGVWLEQRLAWSRAPQWTASEEAEDKRTRTIIDRFGKAVQLPVR
ncbi:MAG: PilZ domain-containing protein [Acidobacteria bacterium]|nr:PilZ domain-containing protein [Acidobacteriota bacterium]